MISTEAARDQQIAQPQLKAVRLYGAARELGRETPGSSLSQADSSLIGIGKVRGSCFHRLLFVIKIKELQVKPAKAGSEITIFAY
jgi:hypothetical protein